MELPNGESLYPKSEDLLYNIPGERSPFASLYKQETKIDINANCKFCGGKIVNFQETVIVPKCGHPYHIRCGMDWFSQHPHNCLTCPDEVIRANLVPTLPRGYYTERQDISNNQVPVRPKDIIPVRKQALRPVTEPVQIQQQRTPDVIEPTGGKGLTWTQRCGILGTTAMMKKGKENIDVYTLTEKGITVSKLIDLGIDLTTMWTELGIKKWDDLLSLSLQIEDIPNLGLQKLSSMFSLDYHVMKAGLRLNINSLIDILQPDPLALVQLSLNFADLIEEGMTIDMMRIMNFSVFEWKEFLGMTKEHLDLIGFNRDVMKILGWNTLEVCQCFSFDDDERRRFGINVTNMLFAPPVRRVY